jgi:hypothetical protein
MQHAQGDNYRRGYMAMGRLSRSVIVKSIFFVLVLSVGVAIFVRYIDARIAASVDFETAKTTTATVLSVTKTSPAHSLTGSSDEGYRVCFTIDNFDQISSRNREGYQAAELKRLTSDGPRCKETTKVEVAKSLTKGSKISVVYLQENSYQISVARIKAQGEEL